MDVENMVSEIGRACLIEIDTNQDGGQNAGIYIYQV